MACDPHSALGDGPFCLPCSFGCSRCPSPWGWACGPTAPRPTSIALVEYMGDDYPEPDKADDQARQAAQALDGATMADIDGVTLWETSAQTLAALSGYERREGAIPYEDYGVVVVSNLSPMYEDGIQWQPDTFRLPDTACGVTNIATRVTTYYVPGLEPLEVPWYF